MTRKAADVALRLECVEGFGDGAASPRVRLALGRASCDLSPEEARRLAARLVRLADAFGDGGEPAAMRAHQTYSGPVVLAATRSFDEWYRTDEERESAVLKITARLATLAKRQKVTLGAIEFADLVPGSGEGIPERPSEVSSDSVLLRGTAPVLVA